MRTLLFVLFTLGVSICLHAAPQRVFELDPNRKLEKSDSTAPTQFQSYGQYLFYANDTGNLSFPKSERPAFNWHDVWRLDTRTNTAIQVVVKRHITDINSRSYYVLNDKILYFTHAEGFIIADLNGKVVSKLAALRNADTINEPQKMSQVGSIVYFPAFNPQTKKIGLWRSSGTVEGTEEVPLCVDSICYTEPKRFQLNANKLFFIATSPNGKHALWVINSQNKAVKFQAAIPDIDSGQRLIPYRDGVLLHTKTELWYHDATEAGSYAIKQYNNNLMVSEAANIGDDLVIASDNLYVIAQHGRGSAKKVEMGMLIEPRNLTILQNKLFFTATLYTDGRRLYGKLMEMNGVNSPNEIYTFEFDTFFDYKIIAGKGNKLLLLRNSYDRVAPAIRTSELWVSDGTKSGTAKISDTAGVPYPLWTRNAWAFVNNDFYYSAYSKDAGVELWRTDGTVTGTVLSKDLAFGVPNAHFGQMVTDGNTVFRLQEHKWYKTGGGFEGNITDIQLWKTDTTTLQSSFIAEWPSSDIDLEKPLAITDNGVYLWVRNTLGSDLMFYHKQNGSLVKVREAVDQSCTNGRNSSTPVSVGNFLYFQAPIDTNNGKKCQLWVSDGTAVGTKAITNFDLPTGRSELIRQATQFQNELYYTLSFSVSEFPELTTQVFKTDGTADGTKPVFRVPKAADSPVTYINKLIPSEKGIFVVTQSLQQQAEHQQQLWYWAHNELTDLGLLTEAYGFVRFRDGIAFVASGSIYTNDGTSAVNHFVRQFPGNQNDSDRPLDVTPDFQHVLFTMKDDTDKIRLWLSDGSTAGTVAIGQPLPDFSFTIKTQAGQDLYLSTYQKFSEVDSAEQLLRYSLNDSSSEIYTEHYNDPNFPLQAIAAQGRIFIGGKLQLPSFGGPYVTANLDDGDLDKDGILNKDDIFPLHPDEFADFDADRIGDNADPDDDNDEVPDNVDLFPKNALEWRDQDQDKIGDNADTDDDNDGVSDWLDSYPNDATKHSNQVSSPGTGPTEPAQPSKPVTESSSGGAVSWLSLCWGFMLIAQRRRYRRLTCSEESDTLSPKLLRRSLKSFG